MSKSLQPPKYLGVNVVNQGKTRVLLAGWQKQKFDW